jgi:hypothetical protein
VSGDQQGQKVCVDKRERGQCVARERSLYSLQSQGVAASFLKDERGVRLSREGLDLGFFLFVFPLLFCSSYGWRFTYVAMSRSHKLITLDSNTTHKIV